MTEKRDDNGLVKLLQKGNVLAFDSLFQGYSPKLYGFALKYLKNETDAEELVQEVFVTVWENRQTLKSELSFKSYLFTIALNRIRKHFNKMATSLRYLETLNYESEVTDSQLIQDNYESVLQRINLIIERMPQRRREIFVKSKLEGMSSKEIAVELDITTGTVDNQVSDALRFIRNQLKKEDIALLLFVVLFVY